MQMEGGYNTAPNPNKKLYNAGSEWQDDIEGLADYYSTFFREYDPMIGRFNGVDPMSISSESWTTYQYSNNNPVNINDPLGDLVQKAETDRGKFFEKILNDLETNRQPAGLGNYTIMYSGDDESGNGGEGSAESLDLDNPISVAVLGLHIQWNVSATSLGPNGFNNVVFGVISGGGATMTFGGDKFKNLTAGETVRQQVKTEHFDDALSTILSAYKDVLNFNTVMMKVGYTKSFHPDPNFGANLTEVLGNKVDHTFSKLFFTNFANNAGSNYYTFGLLVRQVYHEFIHGWDLLGIKDSKKILRYGQSDELEFRAHYLMFGNVNLPQAPDRAIKNYWQKEIVDNCRGERVINSNNSNKHLYTGWYNIMNNFIPK